MKKQKYVSIVALACYAAFLLAGLLMGLGMLTLFHTNDAEGIGGAALAVLSVILSVAGFIYAALSILPLVFRAISLKKRKTVFPALCVPFDLLYIVLNVLLLVSGFSGETEIEPLGIVIFVALILISIAALVSNILSIVFLAAERKRAAAAIEPTA